MDKKLILMTLCATLQLSQAALASDGCATNCGCAACSGKAVVELIAPKWYEAKLTALVQLPGSPKIVTLFRADCAPCVAELALLPKIAADNPQATIAVVSLQNTLQDKTALTKAWQTISLPQNLHVITPADSDMRSDTTQLLKDFGDAQNALPYSFAMRAHGKICARHYGVLGRTLAKQWVASC